MPRHHFIISERAIEDYKAWNPKQINPALLTTREYAEIANPSCKSHPSNAYDVTLEKLNQWGKKADYELVRRFKIRGVSLELMVKQEDRKIAIRNPDDEASDPWLRDENDQIIYYTDEERERLGIRPYEWTLAIFHGDERVAAAEDEWGCMLVMVAKEYRGLGLGPLIGKAARTLEPEKNSGGFTPSGYNNFLKVHAEFVRDALRNGLYTKLVKSGQITKERVKEIIASVNLQKKTQTVGVELSSDDPKDWLLYADGHGTFIVYDRKLPEMFKEGDEKFSFFAERMIKGFAYAMPHESAGVVRVKRFHARDKKMAAFMLALVHTFSKQHQLALWVEKEEYDLQGFSYGEESKVVGYSSREVINGPVIDYTPMLRAEHAFRQSFDQYDEFQYRLHEYAESVFN